MSAALLAAAGDRARHRAAVARTPGTVGLDRADARLAPDGTLRLRLHWVSRDDGTPGAPAALDPRSLRVTGPAGPVAVVSADPPPPQAGWTPVVALPPQGAAPEGAYTVEVADVAGLDPLLAVVGFTVGAGPRPAPRPPSASPEQGGAPPAGDRAPFGTGAAPPPAIDYLVRDYTTFRAAMLDRMAATLPAWTERSPADIGVMLVELLAYAADQLSYSQDAVGTEAYLATARLRTSLARHARLLDYRVNEGCSAVAWVQVRVASPGIRLPAGTRLYTRTVHGAPCLVPGTAAYTGAMQEHPLPFETVEPLAPSPGLNQISIYTGGAASYTLPAGARGATFLDAWAGTGRALAALAPGQVLVLQEMVGPGGAPADPAHRQAVRLTSVRPRVVPGPGGGVPLVDVEWHTEDALDFDLGVSGAAGGAPYTNGAVALGNLVLAEHGTVAGPWELPPVPERGVYRPYVPVVRVSRRPPPALRAADRPASAAADPADALAQVWLTDGDGWAWTVRADLLGSTPYSRDFVVEADEEGASRLRFGDGALGMAPPPGTRFLLRCRMGVGLEGNVGREVLAHLAAPAGDPAAALRLEAGVLKVLNPLAARGGAAPETVRQVRVRAPRAYQVQRRGITPADWVALAGALPGVRRAGAAAGWEATSPQDRVWVQRRQGFPEDGPFLARVRAGLEPFRPAGRGLRVLPPEYVGVQAALRVHLDPRTLRAAAGQALRGALGGGPGGVFDRAALTFGQGVWLSRLVAAAAAVAGVVRVDALRFARWQAVPAGPAVLDELPMAAHEVAQMRDDASAPWNGTLSIELHGGIG